MLIALTANNQPFICTSNLQRDQLKKIRQAERFYCPQCKEEVLLKIGSIKIPHFAHKKKSACEQAFSEGETELHLLGKEQLYQMFLRLNMNVELESYIKELSQRPDLLVTDKQGKRYAIEFQCSPISSEKLQSRTNGYLSLQITPIWIFLTPSKMLTYSTTIRKLSISSTLQQQKSGTSSWNQFILTYNPTHQSFHYFSHLLHIHDNQFIAKCLTMPIAMQVFPFYEPAPLKSEDIKMFAQIYKASIQRYSHIKLLTSKKGINDHYLKACYELRLNPLKLPYYVGIPVLYAYSLPMTTLEWQVQLLYFACQRQRGLQAFTSRDCSDFLVSLKLTKTPDRMNALAAYITYFRAALGNSSSSLHDVERYLVNELLSNPKIEKI